MKKLFLLFLSLGVLSSCSSDDDNNTGEDLIIGNWVLVSVTPPVVNFQGCEEDSTITFNADNTTEGTFYLEEGDCEPATSEGNWSVSGNNYTLEMPFLDQVTGAVNFQGNNRMVFSSSGVVLTFDRI